MGDFLREDSLGRCPFCPDSDSLAPIRGITVMRTVIIGQYDVSTYPPLDGAHAERFYGIGIFGPFSIHPPLIGAQLLVVAFQFTRPDRGARTDIFIFPYPYHTIVFLFCKHLFSQKNFFREPKRGPQGFSAPVPFIKPTVFPIRGQRFLTKPCPPATVFINAPSLSIMRARQAVPAKRVIHHCPLAPHFPNTLLQFSPKDGEKKQGVWYNIHEGIFHIIRVSP